MDIKIFKLIRAMGYIDYTIVLYFIRRNTKSDFAINIWEAYQPLSRLGFLLLILRPLRQRLIPLTPSSQQRNFYSNLEGKYLLADFWVLSIKNKQKRTVRKCHLKKFTVCPSSYKNRISFYCLP